MTEQRSDEEAVQEVVVEETVETEEHQVRGDSLIAKIKELIHEGNITRVIIKNDQGRTLIEIPLSLGVVGIALAPVWAAIGAIAALAADLKVVVEKKSEKKTSD
ncbi:MAG: DUF4342 domain-containing protein [Gemmatimonadetes bacterium]|nr:DUF4342 domain-containing protein [Gemmatimonadota bacterium]